MARERERSTKMVGEIKLDAAPKAVEVAAAAEGEAAAKGPLTLLEKRKDVAAHFLPLPDHKKQKTEWAARLRQVLSPPDMLNDDGTIKQDYFKPRKVVIQQDRRWGDAEKEKLLEVTTRPTFVFPFSSPHSLRRPPNNHLPPAGTSVSSQSDRFRVDTD